MKNARLLLERLTEIIPPGANQRHGLSIDERGDLVLHFMMGDQFHPVIIEEDDLDKPVHQLINEIVLALKEGERSKVIGRGDTTEPS